MGLLLLLLFLSCCAINHALFTVPVASRAGRARKVFCRQLAAPASGQGTTCPTGRQAAALGPHPLNRAAAPQARSLRARARATPGAPAPEGGRNPPGDRRPPPPRPAAERAVRRARSAPDAPPQAQQGPGTQRTRREIPEPCPAPPRHAGRELPGKGTGRKGCGVRGPASPLGPVALVHSGARQGPGRGERERERDQTEGGSRGA